MTDIVFVASCNVDLISYVDKMPILGETLMGNDFKIGFGGKGANKAIACSRLGSKCLVISKLGNDVFGKNYIDNFKLNNINTDKVFITDKASTGVAPICVDKDGNNSIIVILGANLLLSPEDIEKCEGSIRNSKILVTNLEIPVETATKSFEIAKKYNVTTVLNFAPASVEEINEKLLNNTDYLILNEIEAGQLGKFNIHSKEDVQQASLYLLENYQICKGVIITLGEKGVFFINARDKSYFQVPCHKVQVVDTSGAGDAFVGAFVHYLNRSDSIKRVIELATEYAGLTVQSHGTQSSYPSINSIDQKFKI